MAGYPGAIWKPAAAGNFEGGRHGYGITRITFHHIVGDAPGAISRFQTRGVEVSAHYVIGSNGQVYQCVDEGNTAYCDGNYDSNLRTISIEHAGGVAGVPYTEAMYQASIKLVNYLIKKYPTITEFKRHRDVIDKSRYPGGTACPGTLNVERIVTTAKGASMAGIPDADNYYWRYGQKLAEQVRGRQLSREEFRKFLVGQSDLRVVEILSDDPEATRTQEAQVVGQLAVKDNWQGQIYKLQDQLKASNNIITTLQDKADISDKLQKQVDDLTAKNQALIDQQAKDTETGNAFIRFIGRLFNSSK